MPVPGVLELAIAADAWASGCREKRSRKHTGDGNNLRHRNPDPLYSLRRFSGFSAARLADSPSRTASAGGTRARLGHCHKDVSPPRSRGYLGNIKSLELLDILFPMHRSITGPVSNCDRRRVLLTTQKKARLAPGLFFSILAWAIWRRHDRQRLVDMLVGRQAVVLGRQGRQDLAVLADHIGHALDEGVIDRRPGSHPWRQPAAG